MPQPTDLRSYPESFFALALAFASGERRSITLAFASEGIARHTQQKFYTFRKLLLASDDAARYSTLRALQIRRVQGTLYFENIDLAGADIEAQLAAQGVLPTFTPAPPPMAQAPRVDAPQAVEPQAAAARFEAALAALGYAPAKPADCTGR